MEIERAKYFVLLDEYRTGKIYKSKDLDELLKRNDEDCDLIWIYAVVETASGDTLMEMDRAYSGEPIIMGRFIHADYFFKHYHYLKIEEV